MESRVTYVCMTPRSWCSDDALELRKSALNDLYMTTHCPHRPKLFPKIPKNYFCDIPDVPEINTPRLTELGMKLSGF